MSNCIAYQTSELYHYLHKVKLKMLANFLTS